MGDGRVRVRTAGDGGGPQGEGEDGGGRPGDGREWVRMVGDYGGRPGTVRVMFHDARLIGSVVYDFNSSQYPNEMMV